MLSATASGQFASNYAPGYAVDNNLSTSWATPAGDDTGDWLQVNFASTEATSIELDDRGCASGSNPAFTVTTSSGQSIPQSGVSCGGHRAVGLDGSAITWVRVTYTGTSSADPGWAEIAVLGAGVAPQPTAPPHPTTTPTPAPTPFNSGPSGAKCGQGIQGTDGVPSQSWSVLWSCFWTAAAAGETEVPGPLLADFTPKTQVIAYGQLRTYAYSSLGQSLYLWSSKVWPLGEGNAVHARISFDPECTGATPDCSPGGTSFTGVEVLIQWFGGGGSIVPVEIEVGGVTTSYQACFGTVLTAAYTSAGSTLTATCDAPPVATGYKVGIACGFDCPASGGFPGSFMFTDVKTHVLAEAQEVPPVACAPEIYGCLDVGPSMPIPVPWDPNTNSPVCGPLSGDCSKPFLSPVAEVNCVSPSAALDIVGWLAFIACLVQALPAKIQNFMIAIANALIDLWFPGSNLAHAFEALGAVPETRAPFTWIAAAAEGIDQALSSPSSGTSPPTSMTMFGREIEIGGAIEASTAMYTPYRPLLALMLYLGFAAWLLSEALAFFGRKRDGSYTQLTMGF